MEPDNGGVPCTDPFVNAVLKALHADLLKVMLSPFCCTCCCDAGYLSNMTLPAR